MRRNEYLFVPINPPGDDSDSYLAESDNENLFDFTVKEKAFLKLREFDSAKKIIEIGRLQIPNFLDQEELSLNNILRFHNINTFLYPNLNHNYNSEPGFALSPFKTLCTIGIAESTNNQPISTHDLITTTDTTQSFLDQYIFDCKPNKITSTSNHLTIKLKPISRISIIDLGEHILSKFNDLVISGSDISVSSLFNNVRLSFDKSVDEFNSESSLKNKSPIDPFNLNFGFDTESITLDPLSQLLEINSPRNIKSKILPNLLISDKAPPKQSQNSSIPTPTKLPTLKKSKKSVEVVIEIFNKKNIYEISESEIDTDKEIEIIDLESNSNASKHIKLAKSVFKKRKSDSEAEETSGPSKRRVSSRVKSSVKQTNLPTSKSKISHNSIKNNTFLSPNQLHEDIISNKLPCFPSSSSTVLHEAFNLDISDSISNSSITSSFPSNNSDIDISLNPIGRIGTDKIETGSEVDIESQINARDNKKIHNLVVKVQRSLNNMSLIYNSNVKNIDLSSKYSEKVWKSILLMAESANEFSEISNTPEKDSNHVSVKNKTTNHIASNIIKTTKISYFTRLVFFLILFSSSLLFHSNDD
ncbi:hypothetical protein AYI69_g7869 [Smittium culicis]|uniref:Uncharacterized protein n=1 Tax=Smittium culicis TaxID=133412 RepID=A0A1R1XNY9_9FUNG|nr:hypothetical protein AYI69_g7869 [Smittium culicis]